MTLDDYVDRTLRHRLTGQDGTITGHATNVIGQVRFRIRFADSSEQLSLGQILDAFEWTDVGHEEPVVALPDNVVPFQSRRARVVPIEPGSGDAA